MAFGGFFGGSSSSNDNSNSGETLSAEQITTTIPPPPQHMANRYSGSGSSDVKGRIQEAVTQQTALANAKYLITKINENCFDHCISEPGSSLSAREQACLSSCMDKYVDAWKTASRAYLARLQKEGQMIQSSGVGNM